VTWGDIEAEDTRHLSEGNFVKVFRLAQLLLEYLLYVQENLKYTNSVLDRSRWVGSAVFTCNMTAAGWV
jgi:zinc finger protein DZIP1